MAKGRSGRIVVEIDPVLKNLLYSELSKEGRTLREWFIEKAMQLIGDVYPEQLTFNDIYNRSVNNSRKR